MGICAASHFHKLEVRIGGDTRIKSRHDDMSSWRSFSSKTSVSVRGDSICNQRLEKYVMAGLDPAIHAPAARAGGRGKGVDARHKAGHDNKDFL